MKKLMTQPGAFWALLHFFVIARISLFAQEEMPIAKDHLKNPEKYTTITATPSLLQTFPSLPPSGRNGSLLGGVVATLGDVNADGHEDWALGLQNAAIYPTGRKTGKVYIYFGGSTLVNEKDPDLILTGEAEGDCFGNSVAAAGDVNQDGFADVIIGANSGNVGGFLVGRAYLYFGGASMDNSADIILNGEGEGDEFGNSVAAAGDVNQDGFSDVIVGAHANDDNGYFAGRAYLYFGGTSMDNVADATFTGEADWERFGNSVASAGDVNHDGFSDVMIGAYESDAGGVDAGRAYIYFGGASMDSIADVTFTGEAIFHYFGVSVSTAGDVNHDGFSDVIVGASGADRAYLYLGGTSMDNTADAVFIGGASGDHFGVSVASAGDVNRDGFSDVIIGAEANDSGGLDAGRAYLYFGGASMNNVADVICNGEASGDYFGNSVSAAGDVNRDGFSDVIVGALWNDAGGYDAGRAYLYFGGTNTNNNADVIFTGEASGNALGNSVSAAGDVNRDGFSDVIVGAYLDDGGGVDAGRAYLYFGGAGMDNIADVIFTGEASDDRFGISVSSAGDVNQDGFSDVIVGAYWNRAGGYLAGRAYLYLGGASMDNIADVVFTGEAGVDYFGYSVSTAGDVNHDGFSDVIVGAYSNDAGGFDVGRAYIYFGGTSMDNIADVIFTGEAEFDRFGNSVAAAGDVNQDGFSDVIVGAEGSDAGGFDAGRAYLYFGGASMDSIADVIFAGEESGDRFGISVAAAGDVNHDGFSDVIVGADDNGFDVGRACLYLGGSSMDNIADVRFAGEESSDDFGFSVSAAGDVNHDGFSDVIIGAHGNNASGFDVGRAYLYLGGASMDNIADVNFTGEASVDRFGGSVSTAGDVNHDGFADVIIGAEGNCAVGYKMGRAYVYAGSAITVGVEDKENELPGRCHLFQNYPNPFNPTTTIRFSLPRREHVTLKIFDLLGKEVATLVEGDLEPGEHAVIFNGNGLSSGVYLCHFKAGAFVEQKRLVLLR
jgi:hypothetical protein